MTETQTKWFNAGTVAAFLRGIARGIDLAAAEIEESGVPVPSTTGDGAQSTPDPRPEAAAAGSTPPEPETMETAPDAGTEPAGTEPGNLELDAAGIPWDARIHSGAKSKTKDGCWRIKKGVDPAVLDSVTAELKSAESATTDPDPNIPEPPAGDQPDLGGIPEPPGAPETPPAEDGPKTFPEFMAALTPHLTSGAITQAQIDHAASKHGLAGALELTQREDLIPAVLAECLALCPPTQN